MFRDDERAGNEHCSNLAEDENISQKKYAECINNRRKEKLAVDSFSFFFASLKFFEKMKFDVKMMIINSKKEGRGGGGEKEEER